MMLTRMNSIRRIHFLYQTVILPAGVALVGFAAASSSSLLDSSLLELSGLAFAFLADGPFVASAVLEVAFRFLASGDLRRHKVMLKRGQCIRKYNSPVICKINSLNMSSYVLKLNRRDS